MADLARGLTGTNSEPTLAGNDTPYAIGSQHFAGTSKLIEELGELQQVLGKIIALGHDGDHWDGTNLHERVIEEAGDVLAAIHFYAGENFELVDQLKLDHRYTSKLALFQQWQEDQA